MSKSSEHLLDGLDMSILSRQMERTDAIGIGGLGF